MLAYTNASPKAVLLGARDLSRRTLTIPRESIPTHLPLIYTFAATGPVNDPQLVNGDAAFRTFGEKTFDKRSKFFTHQTLLYEAIMGQGNSVMLQRVLPDDAPPPAGFALCLDLLAEDVVRYQRNTDGTILRDGAGVPLPVLNAGSPVKVPGYTGKFFLRAIPQANSDGVIITQTMRDDHAAGNTSVNIKAVKNVYGDLNPYQGTRSNVAAGTTSTVYPIMEVADNFEGELGNFKGMRFWAKTTKTEGGVDTSVVDFNQAMIYGIQLVQKSAANTSPYVLETKDGAQSIEFAFKDGAYNPKSEVDLYVGEKITEAYEELNDPGAVPLYAPFGNVHIYHNNIDTVSGLIQSRERVENSAFPSSADSKYLVNFASAVDVEGSEYYTYQVLGPSNGGILLNETATHYAMNGGDGTCSNVTFDALVGQELANFGNRTSAPLLSIPRYPISAIWDSGFSLDTKRKMFVPMGRRKDITVVVSTQVFGDEPNTIEEESSLATALSTAARLYPESEAYGTPVVRAAVVGHCGKSLTSTFKGYIPLTVDLAGKFAKYMGSGDKNWDGQNTPDDTNKIVTDFRNVNNPWKPDATYTKDWTNGLISVQYFDRQRLFYPGLQTAYPDDTSVFNSLITAFILGDLEKVCFESWAEMSGTSKLTPEQFIDRHDANFTRKVNERGSYDGRVVIRPQTVITAMDANNGFSWTTNVKMYANNGMTVGVYTISGYRRSDLAA